MKKILCIDDTPEQMLDSGLSLEETINNIFKDAHYKLIFKKTGEEGIKTAVEDTEIKLVLLDVRFNKRIEGPEIADELKKKAPHVKIIVLTIIDDKGNKISFGWKQNVVSYITKKELSNVQILEKLKNLSKAIIEDYQNKNWEIEFTKPSTINLYNKITKETYGINIPSMVVSPIKEFMKYPNKPVALPWDSGTAELNKVHNIINANVLENTQWKTWGILTKENCAKGQLKLVIGSVVDSADDKINIPNDKYILQSDFEKYKKEIESRLTAIEHTLSLKSSKKK